MPGCENVNCNKSNWCAWGYGGCPEGKMKYLQCVVEKGTFECLGPDSWMYDGGGCLHLETECD